MKKTCCVLLCICLLVSLLCACGSKQALSREQALEKLQDFMEIFDYAEDKAYSYADDGETTIDGVQYYRFAVTWEADEPLALGSCLVSSADGSLRVE